MKERISILLKEKNLSSGKFAEIMEVQPSSISHLLSGRNKPNFDFIEKFLERMPDISPDWFISGKGKMYRDTPDLKNSIAREKDISLSLFKDHSVQDTLFSSPVPSPEIPGSAGEKENKRIERIVIFYSDRTFSVYTDDLEVK